MSVDVRAEVLIECPRNAVAEIMFNPKCDMIWMSGLTKVFPLSAGNLDKGSKVEHVGSFLGRSFSRITLVTKAEPDTLLEFVGDEPFAMKSRYELSDSDFGTKVTIRVQSVAELNLPVPPTTVAKAVKDRIESELKKLKKHLEEKT